MSKETKNIIKVCDEIYRNSVAVLQNRGINNLGQIDAIVSKVFISFFANSLINIPDEDKLNYIKRRGELLLSEMEDVSSFLLIKGNEILEEFNGECPCEKCKSGKNQTHTNETIH